MKESLLILLRVCYMCSMSGLSDLLVQISLYNRTVRSEAANKELPFKKSVEESSVSSSSLDYLHLPHSAQTSSSPR